MAKVQPKDNDDLPNINAKAETEIAPLANNSAKEMRAKVEAGEIQFPLLDNQQARELQLRELKEATKAGETAKVMKPIKDANGIVIDWKEIEVPIEQAKPSYVPGGLTAQANYVETNARLQ